MPRKDLVVLQRSAQLVGKINDGRCQAESRREVFEYKDINIVGKKRVRSKEFRKASFRFAIQPGIVFISENTVNEDHNDGFSMRAATDIR